MKTLYLVTAFLAFLALTPLVAVPAAQTPSRAATEPDIVGIRLGITLEQAQQALRAYNAGVRIRLVYEALPAPAGTRFVSMLFAGVFGNGPGEGDEIFRLEFSNPLPGSRLIGIWRKQTFPQGKELALDNALAAFQEKYGAARFTRSAATLTQWTWARGPGGPGPFDQTVCAPAQAGATSLASNLVVSDFTHARTYSAAPQCGIAIDMIATGFGRLVDTIGTILIDHPGAVRAREEIEAMSRQPDTREIEAGQRGKPKL